MRWAAKVDTTQSEIVKGLKSYGVQVYVIGRPVDLLCRYYDNALRRWLWQPLEVKTPHGKRKPKPRRDSRQETQREFLEQTSTPIVTSLQEAAAALGFAPLSRAMSASCTCPPISPPTSSVGNR